MHVGEDVEVLVARPRARRISTPSEIATRLERRRNRGSWHNCAVCEGRTQELLICRTCSGWDRFRRQLDLLVQSVRRSHKAST